jgi:NAD(P)-dependent dehydrogenase (short-subunit alcohol dehydrogenase family)
VPSKAVLVTGCSTGIGRATAEHLAAKGWTVYATARRPDSIADLREKGCRTLALDVTDDASMQAAVDAVASESGTVGVLVNNAGYGLEGAAEVTPMDEIRRQFETNVFGLFRLCQLVLPGMRDQGWGRIVNISSVGGKMTLPGGAYYHASKHAVEAFSDALRFETAGFGVRVIVVEPGLIKTDFANTVSAKVQRADTGPYAAFNEAVAKNVMNAYDGVMGKLGGAVGPESVAEVIERAITRDRPRTRYRITSGARFILTMRKLLPDRGYDAFLRTQYPRPKPQ